MLIANPRREIAAIDLVVGVAAVNSAKGPAVPPAQLVLDREARQAYRRLLGQLHKEGADLEARGDIGHAVRLRSERDWLERELASAARIGGRSRSFADEGERARISVGKAIWRSLARITDADAFIGDHLRRTIHTGMRCSYWPA